MAVAWKAVVGAVSQTGSSTTLAIPVNTGIDIGDLVVVRWASDNLSATTPTATANDGSSNVYTVLRQGAVNATAAAGVAGGILVCKAIASRPAGNNITLTLSGAVAHKTAYAETYTGVEATVRVAAVGATGTAGGIAPSGGLATISAVGDLLVGHVANETRGTISGSTNTTAGPWSTLASYRSATSGSDAVCVSVGGQYKIIDSNGPYNGLNYNPSVVAAEWLVQIVCLQATPNPTVTQAAYQFFDDAGTESGAASLAALNTATTGNLSAGDGYGVLRVRLQSTNATPLPATDDWQLQYEKNASGSWNGVTSAGTLADSYESFTSGAGVGVSPTTVTAMGQSFTGNGGALSRASFHFYRIGNVAGNVTAALYAHSGTFGTSSIGTGAALATSTNAIAVSSIGFTQSWYDFTFDGTVTLVNGTRYVIMLHVPVGDGSNFVSMLVHSTSGSHGGNQVTWGATPGWAPGVAGSETVFRVYTGFANTVIPYDNPNLTGTAATTNRLGAGTGSFVAGKISEDGTVNDLGWTGNNYTELVYSLKLIAADLAGSDTLRFRVVRNGVTTGMTYTQTPTINIMVGPGPKALAGSASGGSTTTAALVKAVPLAAPAVTGSSTVTSAVRVARALAATTGVGSSTVTSALTVVKAAVALVGTSTSTSAITGTLSVTGVVIPALPGTRALENGGQRNTEGGVPRALESYVPAGPVPVEASTGGTSTATATTLSVTRGLVATAPAGISTTTGALAAARSLASTTTAGTSTASATRVVIARALVAVAPAGTSTTTATKLDKAIPVAATATASSTASATTLVKIVLLAGSAGGLSATTAALARAVPFAGTSAGISTDTGVSNVARSLAASAAGTSITTGALARAVPLAASGWWSANNDAHQ